MEERAIIAENRQEVRTHGSVAFPCAAYGGSTEVNEFPWHWHEEFEFSVVEDGCVEFYVGQNTYKLHPGDGILINSGTLHGIPFQKNNHGRKKDFLFSGRMVYGSYDSVFWEKYMRPLISSGIQAMVFLAGIPWQAKVVADIRQAHEAVAGKAYGCELLARRALTDVFYEIFIHCKDVIGEKEKQGKDNERIKTMLNFIHRHYREALNVEQIAAHANVCGRECLRCFQEFIHMPPMHYVIHYRINSACQLLKTGEYTVTEVCEACGFESPSYFAKTFRRLMGCSPREYKKYLDIGEEAVLK